MKYIRTKDGVYELKVNEELKAQKTSNYFYIQHKGYNCNLLYDKQDLKKFRQADTIEELIDEYVAKKDYSRPFVIKKYEIYSNLQFGFTIYGAIWTDKGLIYVAKMNNKGELELL